MALPAAPTRASTLLDSEFENQKFPLSARSFLTGVKAIDQVLSPSLWTGEKLIGVVSGKGPSLGAEIISEHLLSFQKGIEHRCGPCSGFVIAPHSSNIIGTIHSRIEDRLCRPSPTKVLLQAVQYLETVRLLQYFDFAGLTESVAEVSALLFGMGDVTTVQRTVLYLEGIGSTIEDSQRRSGMVQSNALLSSLLWTLIHLSRTYPRSLILLDLGHGKDSKGEDAIQSAFASETGNDMRYRPGGALGRTLTRTLDVLVVVHDAHGTVTDGSMIVEVVKDRVGGASGQWAVWESKE